MAATGFNTTGLMGGHPTRVNREGGNEDPGGVLLSVDRLVVAARESVRRVRYVQTVSRRLGDDWAGDDTLNEIAARLDEVRCRLTHLRDQALPPGADTRSDEHTPRLDPME